MTTVFVTPKERGLIMCLYDPNTDRSVHYKKVVNTAPRAARLTRVLMLRPRATAAPSSELPLPLPDPLSPVLPSASPVFEFASASLPVQVYSPWTTLPKSPRVSQVSVRSSVETTSKPPTTSVNAGSSTSVKEPRNATAPPTRSSDLKLSTCSRAVLLATVRPPPILSREGKERLVS